MSYTQDAELAHYKTLPAEPILKKLGFAVYEHTQHEGKKVKLREIGYEKGSIRAHPFLGRSGQWMCRFPASGSIDKPFGSIVDVAYAMAGNLGKARQLLRDATGYKPDQSFSTSSTTTTHAKNSTDAVTSPAVLPPLDQVSDYYRGKISEYSPLLADHASGEKTNDPSPGTPPPPPPTPAELEALYDARGPIWNLCDAVPAYLQSRGLESLHPVFHQTFRTSKSGRGSVYFPHFRCSDDGQGWEHAGSEQKSDGWKSYDKGGRAGIWTAALDMVDRLVITESPIDAMSYAFLMSQYDDFSVAFISLRSGGESSAIEYAAGLIEQKGLRDIIIATDNDGAGMLYAAKVMAGLHKQAKSVRMRYQAPIHGARDWNDALIIALEKRKKSGSSNPDLRKNDACPVEYDPLDGIEL